MAYKLLSLLLIAWLGAVAPPATAGYGAQESVAQIDMVEAEHHRCPPDASCSTQQQTSCFCQYGHGIVMAVPELLLTVAAPTPALVATAVAPIVGRGVSGQFRPPI